MIKKGFNILIVMLTGVLLLAHLVVPHHHHGLQVCFVDIRPDHGNGIHEHSCNNKTHQHKHKADDLSCILEKIVMFRTGNSNQESKFLLVPDGKTNSFIAAIISNSDNDEFYSAELNNTSPPGFIKTYTNLAQKIFGLRAPPLV